MNKQYLYHHDDRKPTIFWDGYVSCGMQSFRWILSGFLSTREKAMKYYLE